MGQKLHLDNTLLVKREERNKYFYDSAVSKIKLLYLGYHWSLLLEAHSFTTKTMALKQVKSTWLTIGNPTDRIWKFMLFPLWYYHVLQAELLYFG